MKAKIFRFCGYKFDPSKKKITFDYRIEFSDRAPLEFRETIVLPSGSQTLGADVLRRFLEPLSLILGISYYKLYCPPQVKLPFDLSREQADFWNTVYRKGLGEFCYRNKLDPKKLAKFLL